MHRGHIFHIINLHIDGVVLVLFLVLVLLDAGVLGIFGVDFFQLLHIHNHRVAVIALIGTVQHTHAVHIVAFGFAAAAAPVITGIKNQLDFAFRCGDVKGQLLQIALVIVRAVVLAPTLLGIIKVKNRTVTDNITAARKHLRRQLLAVIQLQIIILQLAYINADNAGVVYLPALYQRTVTADGGQGRLNVFQRIQLFYQLIIQIFLLIGIAAVALVNLNLRQAAPRLDLLGIAALQSLADRNHNHYCHSADYHTGHREQGSGLAPQKIAAGHLQNI